MKILLSYPSEYEQGEGAHYERVLRRMGHKVVALNVATHPQDGAAGRMVCGYPPDVTVQELLGDHGEAHLFLYVEPLGLVPRGLETAPFPSACIISDVHRNLGCRKTLAKCFDWVFLYQRNYVQHFTDRRDNSVRWLPYACDTEVFRDLQLERDLDIAFAGKLLGARSRRHRIISKLSSEYKMNPMQWYSQSEIAHLYSRAKIVVNVPVGNDLNFRVFEALSCGALLITERANNGQEELFKENEHYVAFSTERELSAKIGYYLANGREREEIARAGNAEVMKRHSLELRLATLLGEVSSGAKYCAPIRHMERSEVTLIYARIYERAGQIGSLLTLFAREKKSLSRRLRLLAIGARAFCRRAVLGW
jgi:hypothetical protein